MLQSEIANRLEGWIRTEFSVSPGDSGFGRGSDLFDSGYVDSFGLVELLGFVEGQFGVEISDDLLLSDEFATIEGISHAICRLRAQAPVTALHLRHDTGSVLPSSRPATEPS
jgi:acyl carrier protein